MCYTIVIHFKHYWKELGQGSQTDVVFMDIAKAFDTVDHSKLLQKLREFGFSGSVLLWFQNYSIRRLPAINCSWSHITILAYYI
jgi:hypothetical protein